MATLIAWWKFNNNLTASLGSDGTLAGGYTAVYGTGKFFEAIDMTTQPTFGEKINVSFTIPTNGTIEFWIQPSGWSWENTTLTGDANYHVPFALNASGNPYMYIQYEPGIGIILQMGDQAGNVTDTYTTNAKFDDGVWHHFAFTWGSGGLNVYVDGVLKKSDSMHSCSHNGSTSFTAQICTAPWSGRYFKGYFDNLKIYNGEKTDFSDRFYESGVPPVTTYLKDKLRNRLDLAGVSSGHVASTTNYIKTRSRTRVELTGISAG